MDSRTAPQVAAQTGPPMAPEMVELPLRDIHAAAVPPWWPPAPGWWLLAALVAAASGWLVLRAWRALRRWRFQQALKAEVAALHAHYLSSRDAHRFAVEASTLARRLVVHVARHRESSALTGQAWAEVLAGPAENERLTRAALELAQQPYRPRAEVDVEAVTELLDRWAERSAREARRV